MPNVVPSLTSRWADLLLVAACGVATQVPFTTVRFCAAGLLLAYLPGRFLWICLGAGGEDLAGARGSCYLLDT